ncbi:MAG: hypothetical protein ACFB2Z_07065, partial [Maricaulaceae bacterium]
RIVIHLVECTGSIAIKPHIRQCDVLVRNVEMHKRRAPVRHISDRLDERFKLRASVNLIGAVPPPDVRFSLPRITRLQRFH